jgi:hypothetical protein
MSFIRVNSRDYDPPNQSMVVEYLVAGVRYRMLSCTVAYRHSDLERHLCVYCGPRL